MIQNAQSSQHQLSSTGFPYLASNVMSIVVNLWLIVQQASCLRNKRCVAQSIRNSGKESADEMIHKMRKLSGLVILIVAETPFNNVGLRLLGTWT